MALVRTASNGDPVVVSLLRLEGSADAVAQLRVCAFKAAGLNPDDPFLK